jgi:hypothetical protein
MIGLKLLRESNSHSRDNLVDIAGYTALLEQIESSSPATKLNPRPSTQSPVADYDSFFDPKPYCQTVPSSAPVTLEPPIAPITAEAARALFAQLRRDIEGTSR